MTQAQVTLLLILATTIFLFLWGRWRHDVVAVTALLFSVLLNLVPANEAFTGFGHPAVVTVACVLVLSQGLQNAGSVDILTRRVLSHSTGTTLTIGTLTGLAALLSSFMNNVGALALLMPLAIQIAKRRGLPPGRVLMPLAFGSILGGMTTLIGTPPNLIVSGFRAESGAGSFAMFDFTPVGLSVALAGVIFVALVGWRLIPARQRSDVEGFETGAYLTEARVTATSKAVGKTLVEIGKVFEEADAQIVGLVRRQYRIVVPDPNRQLQADDILVIEAEPESLTMLLSTLDLKLEEDVREKPKSQDLGKKVEISAHQNLSTNGGAERKPASESNEVMLLELAVLPNSGLIDRSATHARLRTHYGINLLAISRQGRRSIRRLRTTLIQAGDVLLMQGAPTALSWFATDYGCVPLAERAIRIPDRRHASLAILVMGGAVLLAALGILPAAIAFALAVLIFVLLGIVPLRNVYKAIDWPVLVLLASLMPVANAMASTGTADLLAQWLMHGVAQGNSVFSLALILVVTMTLSDFMNNAATAAVMCPIAISTAAQLNVDPDSFLMAVAVGASCAFLTPIGHQNNTLILGPGGLRFGDYWKLGLPLEILVVAVAMPILLWAWPL